MPPFITVVLDSRESLRLYSTILAQVEVHLVLALGPDRCVPIGGQTKRSIVAAVLDSAEIAQVNLPEIISLSVNQKINYDREPQSLHFF